MPLNCNLHSIGTEGSDPITNFNFFFKKENIEYWKMKKAVLRIRDVNSDPDPQHWKKG